MYGNFLGYFENITFQEKTAEATFWAIVGRIWAMFYISIWSHCHLVSIQCDKMARLFFQYLAIYAPQYEICPTSTIKMPKSRFKSLQNTK